MQLQFFAYGDDDAEVFTHLDTTFDVLQLAATDVNRQVKDQTVNFGIRSDEIEDEQFALVVQSLQAESIRRRSSRPASFVGRADSSQKTATMRQALSVYHR